MLKLSKKYNFRQHKVTIYASLFNVSNLLIIALSFLILNALGIKDVLIVFISFLILIVLVFFEIIFDNNYNVELKSIALIKKMMHLIILYRLNEGIEDAIIHSYTQIFNKKLESEARNKKIEEIKIIVNYKYLDIFLDACINNNNYSLLTKLEKQIEIFSLEKEFTIKYKTSIANKIFLSLSLVIILFSLLFLLDIEEKAKLIYLISFVVLFLFNFVMQIILNKILIKSENERFFYEFYLWSMFKRPYIAFDLTLENSDNKKRNIYDKNKIISCNYEDNLLNLEKEEGEQYMKVIDILKRNAYVREIYYLNSDLKEQNILMTKLIQLFYFSLPVITFIIVKFYL